MKPKNDDLLGNLLNRVQDGADVAEFHAPDLRTILESRHSEEEKHRDRERARIIAKITAAGEAMKRGIDPDEAEARLRSVNATVRAVNWCLHDMKRGVAGKAIEQWCRDRARDICIALARENRIGSANESINDRPLSEFIAKKIRDKMPAWIKRDSSTIKKHIKHELRRHVAEGIRQRQK